MNTVLARGVAFNAAVALLCLGLGSCNGTDNAASGTDDSVVVTASIPGTVTIPLDSSGTENLIFTSSDANPISVLSITSGLNTLPTGWSGPTSFGCITVTTSSGCVLALQYASGGAASGSVTLGYSYMDDAGVAKTGSVTIPYISSTQQFDVTVVGQVQPAGEVAAIVGSSATATVVFTPNPVGLAATNFATTNLNSLPAGWTSSPSALVCQILGNSNNCKVTLTFAPTQEGAGTLTLNYSYLDVNQNNHTGSVSIPYVATTQDNIVTAVSPPPPIVTQLPNVGSGQVVTVTFTTDDGQVASSLYMDLSTVPTSWGGPASAFTCALVSTGSGCQLSLTFAPTSAGNGTLSLPYNYTDHSGTARTGTLSIPYNAVAANTVTATPTSSGMTVIEFSAIVGNPQSLVVNFATSAGTATQLSMDFSSIDALPSGWSYVPTGNGNASTFSCASIGVAGSGSTCQLALSFAPSADVSGAMTLVYYYTNNLGSRSAGAFTIPYQATTDDNVTAALSTTGTVAVPVGTSQSETVTFTTDDGNAASNLAIAGFGSGGIGTLPAGWTVTGGAGSFSCSSVSTGTGCQLALTYTPVAAVTSGTVSLTYTYLSNSGATKTGTVTIPYSSTAPNVYVADLINGLYLCTGSIPLSNCRLADTADPSGTLNGPSGIAFTGTGTATQAYVALKNSGQVDVCAVHSDGTLSNCWAAGTGFNSPAHVAVEGSYVYVANSPGGMIFCAIGTSGALTNCGPTATNTGNNVIGIAFDSAPASSGGAQTNYALVLPVLGTPGISGDPWECVVDSDGTLTGATICQATGSTAQTGRDITAQGGYAYIADSSQLTGCAIGTGGLLSGCAGSSIEGNDPFITAVGVNGGVGYVAAEATAFDVLTCTVSGVSMSGCTVSDGGASFSDIWGITVH